MYVNKESRLTGSGGLVVYDINRNSYGYPSLRPYQPFVVAGSDKIAFKTYQHQPLIQNHSGDFQWTSAYVNGVATQAVTQSVLSYADLERNAITISDTRQAITASYSHESPIERKLTGTSYTLSGFEYFDVSRGIVTTTAIQLASPTNITASALQNVARKYTVLSEHFIFTDYAKLGRDLIHGVAAQNINFIFIPNMYYGSTIKKGSVELNYYLTGSKVATCADINHNGTLIGTTGSTSGSVVGLVLYDEGVIMLTSSANLETGPALGIKYDAVDPQLSSWRYYGTTLNDGISHNTLASASYDLNFKGTNYVNSMTMFAHARKGQLNHSNNPTYRNLETTRTNETGSGPIFAEGPSDIANIVSGSHISASFDKTTYISKVHIYDEDGNLIGITSLANPIKKTLTDEFTFKMKLDL
jgi:hypothetical protein